jgi:hypothetical protein
MPVIRAAGSTEPVALVKKRLTELLVKELLGDRRGRGPVVFEIPAPQTKSIDVIVVWEAWKDLSPEDRISVIRGAYSQFKQTLDRAMQEGSPEEPVNSSVPLPAGIVIGATWKDVEELNLLPYSVVPQVNLDDDDERDFSRLLMFAAGAIENPNGGIQLRFPTEEMASEAQTRLQEEMPDANWAIVRTVGSIDDWSGR